MRGFRRGIHLHKFLLTSCIPLFINNLSIVMYDIIDTTRQLWAYLNICSFLQICVHYCIDVVAVVEIHSNKFN